MQWEAIQNEWVWRKGIPVLKGISWCAGVPLQVDRIRMLRVQQRLKVIVDLAVRLEEKSAKHRTSD